MMAMDGAPVRIINLGLANAQDVVLVRQRARQVSQLLGLSQQDQVRVATALSEVARSACLDGARGRAEFFLAGAGRRQVLEVVISGQGAGADALPPEAVVTAQRLMDECGFGGEGAPVGFTMRKLLPATAYVDAARLADIGARLAKDSPAADTYLEVHQQNQELVATLAELRERQDDLMALTRELEDTNRGIVALYAEIEDKAERLRRADEMKSRFLSNTSHELRTPLSSIRALSKLLLDRMDGDLTVEQERQVRFIESAANDLSELVNDLLDLAKIEAGKVDVLLAPVEVDSLFSALKGALRPLVDEAHVALEFEMADTVEPFESDEGKISQVLRNFISNALKFTEHGSVTVSARDDAAAGEIVFTVTDTGIGISPDNLLLIFEEFSQIEHPLQRRSKGTGLGLPLCRKLAHLLGGRVEVASVAGAGSTFSLVLPRQFSPPVRDDVT
jgi:signal transduction histidine kinase